MKFLFILFVLFSSIFAEKLIIDSTKFEADDASGVTVFTGNVKMTKSEDYINSDKLTVVMVVGADNKRSPKEYIAVGNVDFKVVTSGKTYLGKGDKIIYNPISQRYTILGNGYLEDKTMDRKVYGNEIYIDELSGEATVKGDESKPVRFIIKIEDKKK